MRAVYPQNGSFQNSLADIPSPPDMDMNTLRWYPAGRLFLPTLALWMLRAAVSHAQTAEASCEAVERTEAMRAAGHYREARARLLECVNAQCGGDVRRRCAATLQKLDAVTPSVVVRAYDGKGNDVTDVTVSLGNEPLASSLDGMALPVDPGEHRFVFRRAGFEPVTQTVTIRQGEKFKSIEVQVGPDDPAPLLTEGGAAGSAPLSSTQIAAGGTLIGVGVAGLVGFTWLGLSARSEETELKDGCSPECSDARVSSVRTRYVLSNVSLGVAVAALGGAAWVLLSGGSSASIAEPADSGIAIVADGEGARAAFSGSF